MTIFLVPVGRDRYELYSETPDEATAAPGHREGAVRRWLHAASVQWHAAVDAARRGKPRGRIVQWRDAFICRLAERIAEQRTLWALRHGASAVTRFPSTLQPEHARRILDSLLAAARHHHLWWFVIDLVLFVSSVVFFFVPGPNLIAYYFAFRFVGHLQSWRGARHAMERVAWTLEPDAGLAELASLVEVPPETRAPRVAAIAARLNLPRLSAFFERVAVRST